LAEHALVWPYVINTYLKGNAPFPFDLLYWNSDATRLPAANHSFYLRNCYLDNKLAKGAMVIGNTRIDLKSIKVPIYNLATREDHIAPAKSVLLGSKCFGGKVKYVLSGSAHIAGVINPPDKKKYEYWTGPNPRRANLDAWLAKAKKHPGSWWPDCSRGSNARTRPKSPLAPPATASLNRSKTRREATSKCATEGGGSPGTISSELIRCRERLNIDVSNTFAASLRQLVDFS
jgi:poly(3-hydroxyalkanoate) synthetase